MIMIIFVLKIIKSSAFKFVMLKWTTARWPKSGPIGLLGTLLSVAQIKSNQELKRQPDQTNWWCKLHSYSCHHHKRLTGRVEHDSNGKQSTNQHAAGERHPTAIAATVTHTKLQQAKCNTKLQLLNLYTT